MPEQAFGLEARSFHVSDGNRLRAGLRRRGTCRPPPTMRHQTAGLFDTPLDLSLRDLEGPSSRALAGYGE
jgi:hypothetical protein